MDEGIIVITTTETKEDAEKLAEEIITNKLGTCVQIEGPIMSVYRWHGKVQRSKEFRMQIKTIKSKFQDLDELIRNVHPYEVPEVVALPIVDGSKTYLNWLVDEIK